MASYEFDLIIEGLDLESDAPRLEALEDRVHDMTFASLGGETRVAVERRAPSLAEAIRSAIVDVESIEGARVVRVEPDEHVSQVEIASRLKRSRQAVSQWVSGKRGPGGFPPPAAGCGQVALWRWSDVTLWLTRAGIATGREDVHRATVVAAVNALLAARRAVSALDDEERASLTRNPFPSTPTLAR